MKKILEVKDLQTSFFTPEGVVKAVDHVSFDVKEGKTLGIVGESGCGKSVTSLSIMRLIPSPPGKIVGGEVLYEGQNLLEASADHMRFIRGNEISMIFQEPMTALNPVFTVGNQIAESIILHQDLEKSEVHNKCVEMLKLVGIPSPEKRVHDYPHQLSGGMRQRVMIAMALACNPKVLIADEPTTALDVTIQAQILELLKELQVRLGMGLVLITHDLGVVAQMADDVMVMYAGKVVESAPVKELFARPKHPYTQGLLRSVPSFTTAGKKLYAIPGIVPNLKQLPRGCSFIDRCEHSDDECRKSGLELRSTSEGHQVRCVKDIEMRRD